MMMAIDKRKDGSQPDRTRFWDSRRNVILLIGAVVTIFVGLVNISSQNIAWLNVLVGILLTIIAAFGLKSLDDWIILRVREEISKNRPVLSAEEFEEDKYKRVYASYAEVFGLTHENLVIRGTLHDDGSMTVMRQSKLVAHSAGISAVDQYLLSDASQGTIEVNKVECPSSPFRKLSQRVLKATADSLALVIDIAPPLMEGESIEIPIPEKTPPGAISTTYQEMMSRKKSHDYECFHWDITRPTDHLEIKILIPTNLASEHAEPDVWYGPSRIRCVKEFRRISASFKEDRAGTEYKELSLNIPFPVPGLRYAIKWIPNNKKT